MIERTREPAVRAGFTIVEVVVALLVLGLGVVALAGSSGAVTRMIGQGRRDTRAAQAGERRLEALRQQAIATTPACTGLAGGTQTADGITETWTVTSLTARTRLLRDVVRYPTARGLTSDTLATILECLR